MTYSYLQLKCRLDRNRLVKKICLTIIILLAIVLLYFCFLIYLYFYSEPGWLYGRVFKYTSTTYELTESQVEMIEKEFDFSLPPGWKITRLEISCNGRLYYNRIYMEGELNDIDNIREYLPYRLPDDIRVDRRNYESRYDVESYDINELDNGNIYFFCDDWYGDNCYKVRISKLGLNNKFLPFSFEMYYCNRNYRIVKSLGQTWQNIKLSNSQTSSTINIGTINPILVHVNYDTDTGEMYEGKYKHLVDTYNLPFQTLFSKPGDWIYAVGNLDGLQLRLHGKVISFQQLLTIMSRITTDGIQMLMMQKQAGL